MDIYPIATTTIRRFLLLFSFLPNHLLRFNVWEVSCLFYFFGEDFSYLKRGGVYATTRQERNETISFTYSSFLLTCLMRWRGIHGTMTYLRKRKSLVDGWSKKGVWLLPSVDELFIKEIPPEEDSRARSIYLCLYGVRRVPDQIKSIGLSKDEAEERNGKGR